MPGGMKLYYFKGRGRAEIIRLTLAQGGIDYEDVRMEWPSQQWEELKKGEWRYLIFMNQTFKNYQRFWRRKKWPKNSEESKKITSITYRAAETLLYRRVNA